MFLILGEPNALTNRLYAKLKTRGKRVGFLNPKMFPTQLSVAAATDEADSGFLQLSPESPPIALDEIEGVYWWFYSGIGLQASAHYHDFETSFFSTLLQLECLWVNPPQAIWNHAYKLFQAQEAAALGALIPESLLSNDLTSIEAFIQTHQGQVIIKNITATGVPQRISSQTIESIRLNAEATQPALFQHYIEGTDVRVHVVDQCLFATEILSEHLVSKIDIAHPQRHTLPDEIAELCLRLNQHFGLVLSGIDFRRSPEGQYYFLEANPSPQYPVYEDRNQYPISEAIVQYLTTGQAVGL